MALSIEIGDKTYKIPTSWYETTLGQFLALRDWDEKDFAGLIAILCGADRLEILRAKQTDIDEKVVPYLHFLKTSPDGLAAKAKDISIDGKRYQVPTNLGLYTFGQKLALQNKITEVANANGTTIDAVPFALAVYFYPIVTGKEYSTDEAEKFIPTVLTCAVPEALAVADFFLKRYAASQVAIQNTLHIGRIKSKSAREWIRWLSSKISRRSTRSPEGIYSTLNRF